MRALLVGMIFMVFLAGCDDGNSYDYGTAWIDRDVLVVDVDGDGRADVLTLVQKNFDVGLLMVYIQTATPGVFSAPVTYGVGKNPWQIAFGNLDNDDRLDLVIADWSTKTTWLMLQDAGHPGQFLDPEPLINGASNSYVVVADLNDDGAPDVAVNGAPDGGGLIIRYQEPVNRGSFGPQVVVTLPVGEPYNLATGDIDGDGLVDLLTGVKTNPGRDSPIMEFVVMYQEPGGDFTISDVHTEDQGFHIHGLTIADINADGHNDLFAMLDANKNSKLVVFPQALMDSSFGLPVYTLLSNNNYYDDVVLANIDQDNLPDAVLAFGKTVSLLRNNGQGVFELSEKISVPFGIQRLSAGDLDGDGRNDLVLLDEGNRCLVMYQTAVGSFLAPREI